MNAVIDLGTNTFHLLVARSGEDGTWETLFRERIYVKLAEDGIHHIGEAAFQRGLAAVKKFRSKLDEMGIPASDARAFGTAALRTADNAGDFFKALYEQTGIRGEAIDGHREALLIYKGVKQAVPFPENGKVLIMDIGGGSVEFIIADRDGLYWRHSFPVGVAILFQHFHKHDPISKKEIYDEQFFLEGALSELWTALEKFPCESLVGASGTFDVIDMLLMDPETKPLLYGHVQVEAFEPLYKRIVATTKEERRAMTEIPEERVEMVVVAMVLIRYVLERTGFKDIYTSVYAMKEGMLVG